MKKNGFTLIEMIATIVLLAAMATVILVSMTGVKNNEDESSIKDFKEKVEEAACTYIDLAIQTNFRNKCKEGIYSESQCRISLSTLIRDDIALLDPETVDPSNNKKLRDEKDNIYVQIKWVNNDGYKEKKCEMVRS